MSKTAEIEILLVEDNPNDVELTLRAFGWPLICRRQPNKTPQVSEGTERAPGTLRAPTCGVWDYQESVYEF